MKTRKQLMLIVAVAAACLYEPTSRANPEPSGGCQLAVANKRQVLRAAAYLHPAIPARILFMVSPTGRMAHVALIYRLTPEGWFVYDDTLFSRRLFIPNTREFPDPLKVAREAFPGWNIVRAHWL